MKHASVNNILYANACIIQPAINSTAMCTMQDTRCHMQSNKIYTKKFLHWDHIKISRLCI